MNNDKSRWINKYINDNQKILDIGCGYLLNILWKNKTLEIDGIEEDNEAIKNLNIARMSMMNFMKDFSNEFSFDKYPMDKKTHDNLEGIDLLQVNNKLNEFKKSIDDVSEKFETSMSSGQKILDGIE